MEIEIKNTAPLDFNAPWLFFGPLVFNLFEMITLSQMKASTYGDIFQKAALSGNEVKKKKKKTNTAQWETGTSTKLRFFVHKEAYICASP